MNKLELILPPKFLELCAAHFVSPDAVIRGFIGDLCGLDSNSPDHEKCWTNGSDERDLAEQYFGRCCYGFLIVPELADLKNKTCDRMLEKIKEALAAEEQELIQGDVESLIEETMIEVFPLAEHHPDRYDIGREILKRIAEHHPDIGREILKRIEATGEYKQLPEDWQSAGRFRDAIKGG